MKILSWLFPACAVCFGDPASSLSRGLAAAALFMITVAFVVLSAIAACAIAWSRK